MKNLIFKCFAILMCVVLLGSSSVSCAEAPEESLWIGDYTITWWIPMDPVNAMYYESYAEHPFFQWLEEKTGVHVVFEHPSYEQMDQQFNAMMSEGVYYDMLFTPTYLNGPQDAIDRGVFADLSQYRDVMPNYFAAIECADGSFSAWEWGEEKNGYYQGPQPAFAPALTTAKGNIWCVSQVWTDAISTETGALIRKDWLDDLGLAVPETIEELEVVLRAFRDMGADVIPMALGEFGFNYSSGYLMSAFDVHLSNFFRVGDTIQPAGWTTEGGYEYLQLVREWYAEGLIDPDFMNRDYEAKISLLLGDRLGIFPDNLGTPGMYKSMYTGPDEDFELVPLPLVRKDRGQQLHYRQHYNSEACNYTVIAGSSPNKEIAARWLDTLFSREVIIRAVYGIENETFVYDENGVPYYTQAFYDTYMADGSYSTFLAPNVTGYWSTRSNGLIWAEDTSIQGQKEMVSEWQQCSNVWGVNADTAMALGYISYENTSYESIYVPYERAETYAAPLMLKIIIGQEDIANYEAICQEALTRGWQEAQTLMQQAYNEQNGIAAE